MVGTPHAVQSAGKRSMSRRRAVRALLKRSPALGKMGLTMRAAKAMPMVSCQRGMVAGRLQVRSPAAKAEPKP